MIRARLLSPAVLATATLAFAIALPGCNSGSHPDDSAAVYQALQKNDLSSVQVQQDRSKGVITLTGLVGDQARKDHAQQLAQQAAPGYTIQNNLNIDNSGVLGMASPNAKPPEVQQGAHPEADLNNNTQSTPEKSKKPHHERQ